MAASSTWDEHAQQRFQNLCQNLSWQLAFAVLELDALAGAEGDIPKKARLCLNDMRCLLDQVRQSPVMSTVHDGLQHVITNAEMVHHWDEHFRRNAEEGSIPNPANDAN